MSRIWLSLWLGLSLASMAHADTSVAPAPASPPSARCSYEEGPFWRASHELSDDERRKLAPFDQLRDAGARHLLYTQAIRPQDIHGSRVLDRKSHTLVRAFDQFAFALVEDRAGALLGVLAFQSGQLALIDAATGKPRWSVPAPARVRDDAFSALVDGNRLLLANYHRYATGSSLVALDLRTGVLLWTAEVEQMNVGHSEYFNDVTLEPRGSTVVMRGFEAAGCYLQSFDLATGRRLSSAMNRQW